MSRDLRSVYLVGPGHTGVGYDLLADNILGQTC
jgi:hypothetical protein